MPSYAPTVNPGDTRLRTRYVGIRVPYNAPPTVEALEQVVIKLKDGNEKVLEDLGAITGIPALDQTAMLRVVALRDPVTDEVVDGQTIRIYEAFQAIYSVIRQWQLDRDAKEAE